MPQHFVDKVFLLLRMNGAYECDINVPMSQRVMALQSDVPHPIKRMQPECGAQSRSNMTPKDDQTPSRAPTNGIYQYDQCIKGVSHKLSPPGGESNPYQVRELLCVKTPNGRYTTQFNKGQVNRVISLQMVLINRTPHYVRDLHRHERSTIMEDDESGTLSESEPGTMLLFRKGLDSSFAESMSEGEDENTKNDSDLLWVEI